MLARCLSGSLHGIAALAVTVEVDLVPGLPGLQLVGLPDAAIQESRERVRSDLYNFFTQLGYSEFQRLEQGWNRRTDLPRSSCKSSGGQVSISLI